jgi:hypothetical protein
VRGSVKEYARVLYASKFWVYNRAKAVSLPLVMIRSKFPPPPFHPPVLIIFIGERVKVNGVHSPFKPGRGLGLTRGGEPSLGNGRARRDGPNLSEEKREGGGEGKGRSNLVYPMQTK